VDEVLQVLAEPDDNLVVNLLAVKLEDRPLFFANLLPRLQELRASTGRPHWLVVDEAHHVLPASWDPARLVLPQDFGGTILITLNPSRLATPVLATVDTVIAVGPQPDATLADFARATDRPRPAGGPDTLNSGQVLVWLRDGGEAPFRVSVAPPDAERRRHRRKYAQGELIEEENFYFRGPEGKLNLRAQNLLVFMQIAQGVDAETWLYHLRRGDYSQWFRTCIKDESLAEEAAAVEREPNVSADDSRQRIFAAIEERYTLPA
jgi:hypothetical protein